MIRQWTLTKSRHFQSRLSLMTVLKTSMQNPKDFIAVNPTLRHALYGKIRVDLKAFWSLEIFAFKIPQNWLKCKNKKMMLLMCVAMATNLVLSFQYGHDIKAWCPITLYQRYHLDRCSCNDLARDSIWVLKPNILGQNCPKPRGVVNSARMQYFP